ncbi:unnamed protein product [Orchesella dallaii]|uniref:ER-bound oxygenase mpaB/mpaB'/Rubber oxygenase catalytic domain-containing protein n=1 Tax=Orchesella dallaii TaxID=48710 RepID=A0ABP1QLP4_9HEXA
MAILVTPEDDIQQIINAARNTTAESNSHSNNNDLPTWLDASAIAEGQKFVRRNFFLIFFVHFISLILLLSYLPVRLVLLKTNRSHTTDLALKRYLSTLRHVKFWYEGDLTSTNGDAVRDVRKVCKIHSGVCQRLSKDIAVMKYKNILCESERTQELQMVKCFDMDNNTMVQVKEEIDTSPHVISQLDMIVTQYCFMGILTTFPQKFGITSKMDKEGLHGFIHIWAVIGHLLGIEDRFNLCIGEKTQLKECILHDILLKDLFTAEKNTMMLWNALVSAMSTFVPCLSINASLLYILDQTLDMKVESLRKNATIHEQSCYKFMIFLFTTFFQFSTVRSIFNNLLRLAICVASCKVGIWKVIINVS